MQDNSPQFDQMGRSLQIQSIDQWQRPQSDQFQSANRIVAEMVLELDRIGPEFLISKSEELDGFQPKIINLLPFESYALDPHLKQHLRVAARRIERFAKSQRESLVDLSFSDECGSYGHRFLPMETAGCYIPGGRFPLVSSALMTLIPAKIAGVGNRIAVSPSSHPAIQAAASLAGATHFLQMGGAQAILALARGFMGLPKAQIICGPGNAFVNAAKAKVQDQVKIDSLAGPSEILVLADAETPVEFVVQDLLAQAEHDPMALSVCAAIDRTFLEAIQAELRQHPVDQIGDCHLLQAETQDELVEFSNKMAPEHLLVTNPERISVNELVNYGSLFLGEWSAVALGDYCSGPNHTLPTNGFASLSGGLSVGDFLRTLTWQQMKPTPEYMDLSETASTLAQLEGLSHHEESIRVRVKQLKT